MSGNKTETTFGAVNGTVGRLGHSVLLLLFSLLFLRAMNPIFLAAKIPGSAGRSRHYSTSWVPARLNSKNSDMCAIFEFWRDSSSHKKRSPIAALLRGLFFSKHEDEAEPCHHPKSNTNTNHKKNVCSSVTSPWT